MTSTPNSDSINPKSIYFASDFHLGLDLQESSADREKRIVKWLSEIIDKTEELYLLGDLFDYWFEYKSVVPRGHLRFLAKLTEFTDRGIPVHVFTGNHDMWMFDYLATEVGATIHRDPIIKEFYGKTFFLGHGDGLGPGDHGYKFIKKVFRSKINQWLFARLHPNLAIWLMRRFSTTSREAQTEENQFLGADKEWLVLYCEKKIQQENIDYFIFGHRHLPIDHVLSNGQSRYINSGDWMRHNTYVECHGSEVELKTYSS